MGFTRTAVILAATALAGAGLLGCAGRLPYPTFGDGRQGQAQEQSVPALEVMVWQGTPSNDERLQDVIDSIDALNPTIEITATFSANYELDLTTALASASPPDVFLVTGSMLPDLVSAGIVAPIPDGWIDKSQLLQSAAAGISVQGKPFCFPHSIHTLALAYNTDLFDEAGVEFPTSDWGWADLASAAARLSDAEEGMYGMVLDPNLATWIPFYLQAGGEMEIDAEGRVLFSEEAAQMAADIFAQFLSEGSAATPSALEASWSGEAFADGKAAMTIAGDWLVPYLESNRPELRYRTAELPRGPAGKATVAFTNCIAVFADSPDRDLALQLAAQLTAPEVLSTWTDGEEEGLFVYIDQGVARVQDRAEYAPFLRGLRYAQLWRLGQFAAEQADLFTDAVEMVSNGDLTPEDFWPYLQRNVAASSPN